MNAINPLHNSCGKNTNEISFPIRGKAATGLWLIIEDLAK